MDDGLPVSRHAAPLTRAGHRAWARPEQVLASSIGVAALALVALGYWELALVTALAVGSALLVRREPLALPAAVAVTLPAGQHLETLTLHVAPLDAVVAGGAVGFVAAMRTGGLPRLSAPHWTYLAFVLCVAVGLLGPADTTARIREIAVWLALGVVFFACTSAAEVQRARRLLLAGLGAAVLVESGFALVEYVVAFSDRYYLGGGAIVYPLPRGTLQHANALAQFLVLGGLTVLALALADAHRTWRRCGVAVAALATAALAVTFSRGSWIALAAAGLVYLADRRTRRKTAVLAGVAVATVGVLATTQSGALGARISTLFEGGTFTTSNFRVELARRAAELALERPLTGPARFEEAGIYAGRADVATHPHNLLLGVAVFFGIPAAIAFGILVCQALARTMRGRLGSAHSDGMLALGALATLVALVTNGLFEYPFWSPPLTALVVLVLGVGVAGDDLAGDARSRARPGRNTERAHVP